MRGLILLPLAAVLSLSGCSLFWRAPVPMRAVDYPSPRGPARCLVVFLPGMGDDAEAFAKNGMVDEVQRRGLSVDIVAASATIGYYSRGIFADRLGPDIIGPPRPPRSPATGPLRPSP